MLRLWLVCLIAARAAANVDASIAGLQSQECFGKCSCTRSDDQNAAHDWCQSGNEAFPAVCEASYDFKLYQDWWGCISSACTDSSVSSKLASFQSQCASGQTMVLTRAGCPRASSSAILCNADGSDRSATTSGQETTAAQGALNLQQTDQCFLSKCPNWKSQCESGDYSNWDPVNSCLMSCWNQQPPAAYDEWKQRCCPANQASKNMCSADSGSGTTTTSTATASAPIRPTTKVDGTTCAAAATVYTTDGTVYKPCSTSGTGGTSGNCCCTCTYTTLSDAQSDFSSNYTIADCPSSCWLADGSCGTAC